MVVLPRSALTSKCVWSVAAFIGENFREHAGKAEESIQNDYIAALFFRHYCCQQKLQRISKIIYLTKNKSEIHLNMNNVKPRKNRYHCESQTSSSSSESISMNTIPSPPSSDIETLLSRVSRGQKLRKQKPDTAELCDIEMIQENHTSALDSHMCRLGNRASKYDYTVSSYIAKVTNMKSQKRAIFFDQNSLISMI